MLHDKEIREPLFWWLEETFGKLRIIEEKNMGGSRADAVMILSDCICGIEIKSDADSYQRLKSQVVDYDRFFDYNFVVAGTSHALHIREHVPEYWGVITVEDTETGPDFYLLRRPERNPNNTWLNKLSLLWRPELAILLEKNELPKYKQQSKDFVRRKLAEGLESGKLPEERLREQYSGILFERDYNTIRQNLIEYRKEELTRKLLKTSDPERKAVLEHKRKYVSQSVRARARRRMRRRRTK